MRFDQLFSRKTINIRSYACLIFVSMWPWPWPWHNKLDIRTWAGYCEV